jgi:hypothetical protein
VGGLSFSILDIYDWPRLTKLKKAYVAFTSILLIFQVAKLAINLFNYGAAVNTQNVMDTKTKVFHGIYIAIVVFEVVLFLGFQAILISLIVFGWGFFYLFLTRFVLAMVYYHY